MYKLRHPQSCTLHYDPTTQSGALSCFQEAQLWFTCKRQGLQIICMIIISAAAKQDIGDLFVNCSADGGCMSLCDLPLCNEAPAQLGSQCAPSCLLCVVLAKRMPLQSENKQTKQGYLLQLVSPLIAGGPHAHNRTGQRDMYCLSMLQSACWLIK